MSKKTPVHFIDFSCTEKCRYNNHGKTIMAVITRLGVPDYMVACFINSVCKNYAQVLDHEGRSALHMAASCGRRNLCIWLVKGGKSGINCKDLESGYTPLHRSIFYGQINSCVALIQMGIQLQVTDNEDLQAIDIALKDRLFKDFSSNNPCQVYVWGRNNNYTLGIGNQDSRAYPELVEFFRKNNISIKQAVTDKFHSVFVSSAGRAWTCGHGQGGRLGVDSENTVLKPQLIRTGGEVVLSAAVGSNHTILLMDSGMVWTCGSNTHYVLGHHPPPPYLLSPRLVRVLTTPVIGVAAARYSSVVWTDKTLYTFGLNGGQLGHALLLGKTIITPKQVSGLNVNHKIIAVSAAVGATVVVVSCGDIYLMNNYQIRRIASKILDVSKVSAYGGELSAEVDQKLSAKGGRELKVMVLTSSGKVLLWQDSFPQFTRCIYTSKRSLPFSRLSMSLSSVVLSTSEGEVFVAHIDDAGPKRRALAPKLKKDTTSFSRFIEKMDCHRLKLRKVPHTYRAVDVATDPKGHNFIVIQEHPSANLTDIPLVGVSEFSQQMAALLIAAHEDDPLHDVTIEMDRYSVHAHHFVLATASEEFANMPHSASVITIKLPGVHVQVLNQVLLYVYTRDCPIIHPGPVHILNFEGDVIKAAFDLAKRWKISDLEKCLNLLRYDNGVIMMKDSSLQIGLSVVRQSWERSMLPSLHDVTVASSDGAIFKAHKCVLAARLEYFNSMFTGGWVETGTKSSLSMPTPQRVLCEILDFLYQDEAPSLMDCQDVDYIYSVLVMADQMFVKRLKEICEVALSASLSLRNATYLLQCAVTYNADQLKTCCMQFICINLVPLMESRILEALDIRCLEELSRYYRNMIPAMSKRNLTPYQCELSDNDIVDIANSCSVNWCQPTLTGDVNDNDTTSLTSISSTILPITSKKKPRDRKISESQRKQLGSSSCNDFNRSSEKSQEKINLDMQNQIDKNVKWRTIDKSQKAMSIVPGNTTSTIDQTVTKLETSEFPQLATKLSRLSTSPRQCKYIKRSPVVKLSQKQHKKLLAKEVEKESPSDRPPTVSAWAVVNNTTDNSLADIMRNTSKAESLQKREGEQAARNFSDIVAEEREKRINFSKMKSKSLYLTQIEDRAIEQLLQFYNASNTYDEHITVERVLSTNIAKPTWINSRNQ